MSQSIQQQQQQQNSCSNKNGFKGKWRIESDTFPEPPQLLGWIGHANVIGCYVDGQPIAPAERRIRRLIEDAAVGVDGHHVAAADGQTRQFLRPGQGTDHPPRLISLHRHDTHTHTNTTINMPQSSFNFDYTKQLWSIDGNDLESLIISDWLSIKPDIIDVNSINSTVIINY